MAPSTSRRKAEDKTKLVQKALSRKNRRKQERKAKRQRRALYRSRPAPQLLLGTENGEEKKGKDCSGASTSSATPPIRKATPTKKGTPVKEVWFSKRRVQSSVAEERDKKEIIRLEKLLKISSKGTKKKLPNSFSQDGLDCILTISFNALML